MKKLTAYVLSVLCVLILAGCAGDAGTSADRDSGGQALIGDDVAEVKITHVLMGQATEWSVEGDDVDALRTWANGLAYELREFEEGNTPGDEDGQEVYCFALNGEDGPELDYIICGSGDCYLLMESDWYAVKNPSPPPVEAP